MTTREKVLELYKESIADKEIARMLDVDPATVISQEKAWFGI